MKRLLVVLLVLFVSVFVFAQKGRAEVVNPYPGVYGADDGAELFYPNDSVFGVELWDTGGYATGSSFGFFFADAPGTLIPIFDLFDETATGDLQSAIIYFDTGTANDGMVWDIDDGMLQASFTPNPNSAIGFYFSTLGTTFFTKAALNLGGLDLAATFPHLSTPGKYLIGFEGYSGADIAFEVFSGITPVPEPSTMLLLGSGLAVVAGYSFRRRRRQAV